MDQSGTDVTPMMGDSHPSYKLTICADSVNRDVSVRASVLKRYMVDSVNLTPKFVGKRVIVIDKPPVKPQKIPTSPGNIFPENSR